jgi:hypothetical protein
MAPYRTVIAHYVLNGQKSSKAHPTLTAPLVLHHTRIYKCAMKKYYCVHLQIRISNKTDKAQLRIKAKFHADLDVFYLKYQTITLCNW